MRPNLECNLQRNLPIPDAITLRQVRGAGLAGGVLLLMASLLSGCGSAPKVSAVDQGKTSANTPVARSGTNTSPTLPKANSGRGGYYKDDGPGENIPPDLESTVDPIPLVEAFSRSGNRPYVVFGKTYTPMTDTTTALKQRGMASWYGKKFHGQKTSSGELYDMYKITAAHPTLPIPSYARVTNLENGKQVIVRINDRGPFHSSRIIDLSYTAALKLGYLGKGSSQLEVERLLPEDIEKMAENRKNQSLPATSNVVLSSSKTPAAQLVPEAKSAKISLDDLILLQENKPAEKIDMNAAPGFYIQFGAYAIRANAELTMSRLKGRLESRLPDFDIVQQGSLYRLISGPFSSRYEASSAMAQNGDLAGAKALVVQR
ncbi:MAG: septal ring lytic transglycosylase RlpA family protein [Undibacterium sp.]|uniref:septal ring lytic transglycosylase RlpA family protein n=1 Tax=Undibacterium sp. TaxID=1914977 RepID=UPI002721CF48|nr:septal ring lytic transglycosylase RlpA family protein [Undibacterium sp.]MDO8650699.1 septal ring lytic transglycosylase RlpA family protein [Undibacterium sp.]